MIKRDSRLASFFLVYDIVLIAISFLLSIYVKYQALDAGRYYLVLPIIVLSWVLVKLAFTNENYYFRDSIIRRFRDQFLDFLLFTGVVSFSLLALDLKLYSRLVVFGTILGFFLFRNLGYLILYQYLILMRKKGRHVSKVLILGAGRIGQQLFDFTTQNTALGYQVVGFLDDAPNNPQIANDLIIGKLDDLADILAETHVDEIIIALPLTEGEKIRIALERADFYGLRVRLIPDYYRLFNRSFVTSSLGNLPAINLRQIPLDSLFNAMLKRLFDILFASAVLIVSFPIMLLIAVMIVLEAPGPILYRPVRVGEGGRKFRCLKFRTMFRNEDAVNSTKSTELNDDRITKLGARLRKYNLDELPQFVNVLMNDMSVVGPRPHRTYLNEHLQKMVDGYMVRHYIKPGITGWAQVNGWRGPTTTVEQKLQRTAHDLWYIENWSFWLDIEIVFKTVLGKRARDNAF